MSSGMFSKAKGDLLPAGLTLEEQVALNLTAKLTQEERATLSKCEAAVTQGIRAFAAAGKALAIIRDKQLFRDTHNDFETYVAGRWKMTRQHAHRLIEAAAVVANLSPAGDNPIPSSERQARPLTKLSPDAQREVWEEVVADAPFDSAGKPVVATESIEAAVAKRRPKKGRRRARPRPTRIKVPGATVIVVPNRKFSGTPADALRAALEKLAASNGAPTGATSPPLPMGEPIGTNWSATGPLQT